MPALLLESALVDPVVLPRPERLHPDAPALGAMTDLHSGRPVTVPESERLEAALQHMIHAGVRLLFSTTPDGALVGVVTSYDIQGEKPVRFLGSKRLPAGRVPLAGRARARHPYSRVAMAGDDARCCPTGDGRRRPWISSRAP